jgi:hypothetical protein
MKLTLAQLYSDLRLGQEAADNITWTYTGKDIDEKDLQALQKMSKAMDTLLEAVLLAIKPEDVK